MIKLGLTCISELLKEVDSKNNSFRVMTRKRFNDLTQSNNKEFAIQQLSERIIHNVKLTKKIINHCIDNNIEIHYHKRRHKYSSTELRNRVYILEKEKREKPQIIEEPEQYSPQLLEKYNQK